MMLCAFPGELMKCETSNGFSDSVFLLKDAHDVGCVQNLGCKREFGG